MNNIIKRVWARNRMVNIDYLGGSAFYAEQGGHTFQISGVDANGDAIALSGTVAGVFLRPDNTDVAITGSASGGVVSVTLPANCYDVPGRFGLTIFLTADDQKTAIYAAVGNVARTSSGAVAPQTTADVVDLINLISAAVATIPASWSGLMADLAPNYSASAVYPVGAYVYYNGDLKRCISPITTAETYTAAHWTSAVLGQDVSDLKQALTGIEDTEINLFDSSDVTLGVRLNSTNGTSAYADGYTTGFIPVEPGKTYYKNSPVKDTYHRFRISDASKGLVENVDGTNIITIPSNGAFVRFCGLQTELSSVTFYESIANDSVARKKIQVEREIVDTYSKTNIILEQGGLKSADGSEEDSSSRVRSIFLDVSDFGRLSTASPVRTAVFVYDSNYNKIVSSGWTAVNTVFYNESIQELFSAADLTNAHYYRFLFRTESDVSVTEIGKCVHYYDVKSVCQDKKISIYGDSISTFSGWVPEGNAVYYTGSNAGVTSVNDMWWKKTIDALNLKLLVNNSWSGRAVSSIRDGWSAHMTDAGYKEENVLQLKSGNTLPDIIIIKLGINDFNSDAILGDYDGSTALPTDPTKFLDAYAIMLNLIMTNFPLAEVYCCTLMQSERFGEPGFPEINGNGDTVGKWNEAIKKLAHAFGAKMLDHDVCGITYYNLSTYMGDYTSSTGQGLHPNALGHSLIANQTIHEMDNAVRVRY